MSANLWQPEGAYDSLATVTVPSGGLASVTFAGIPTGYKHLQLRYLVRWAGTDATYFANVAKWNLNSDTGSNYVKHYLNGSGSSADAGYLAAQGYFESGNIPSSNNTANVFAAGVMDILDYGSVTKNKTLRVLHGYDANRTSGTYGYGQSALQSGLWLNSSTAINSISFAFTSNNIAEYSSFALYGIK